MDEAMETGQFEGLKEVFADQLGACLEESRRGRRGLFSDVVPGAGDGSEPGWPEAARLRELAFRLEAILAQAGEPSALVDEFLELCTINAETSAGEARLARSFLERIERGEVGQPREQAPPW